MPWLIRLLGAPSTLLVFLVLFFSRGAFTSDTTSERMRGPKCAEVWGVGTAGPF